MTTPVPYDANRWKPPEPNSLTSFWLTSFAVSANDCSACTGTVAQSNRTAAANGRTRTRCKLIDASPAPRLLARGELIAIGVDVEGRVSPAAVVHLDMMGQLAPLDLLIVGKE